MKNLQVGNLSKIVLVEKKKNMQIGKKKGKDKKLLISNESMKSNTID